METIHARNVEDAYAQAIDMVRSVGEKQSSRAGDVLVAPYPVMTVYDYPQERVLFDPGRDANCFFHLFESLWILAGRDDAKWLDQFVSDFSERFAEDNGFIYGAYGFRLKKHFKCDQIEECINKLKANPLDRRVVLQMWDPVADLIQGTEARDNPCNTTIFPRILHHGLDLTICNRSNDLIWGAYGANSCLSGDTLLASPEGDITIKDLSSNFLQKKTYKYPIYSFDTSTKDFRISWCTNAWKTGTKRLLRLTFDDGTHLKCTVDHKLYRKKINNSKFCEEVQAGQLKIGDRVWATKIWEAEEGRKWIKRNLAVDTRYSNRVPVARANYAFRTGEPIPFGFDIHHTDEIKSNDRFINLECLTISEHRRHHINKKHPMESIESREKASRSRRLYFQRMTPEERAEYSKLMSRLPSETQKKNMSIAHKRRWQSMTPEEQQNQLDKLHATNSSRFTGKQHSEETKAKQAEAKRLYWARKREELKPASCDNHTIVDITELASEQVYDFTVPGDHNAMLSNGVFVHNCHFSVLQEYLAGRIGVKIGRMYQLSNNWHVYTNMLEKVGEPSNQRMYESQLVHAIPMGEAWDLWDDDLEDFMRWTDHPSSAIPSFVNNWFETVACPMFAANHYWKKGDKNRGIAIIHEMERCDWQVAAQQWFERRMK